MIPHNVCLFISQVDKSRVLSYLWRDWREFLKRTSSPSSSEENSQTLNPPVVSPLDVLRCQETLQHQHILPLQGPGAARLSTESVPDTGEPAATEDATVRNCHSPEFNQGFFFTELSQQDLLELQLRLKVADKPAADALRRRQWWSDHQTSVSITPS